jgi:hypothetical protein
LRVEFLGEISSFLHSRALLPLFPPTPFSHEERRGSLGVLMPETGDGTQGLAKKPTPVSFSHEGRRGSLGRPEAQNERRNAGAFHKTYPCMRRSRSLFFAWMLEYGL